MRKFIETIEQAPVLEQDKYAAFEYLADLQRGDPEAAMLRVQFAMGGGVLNYLVEHVGDLTHRMCEYPQHIPYCGYESVKPKVDRALRLLSSTYHSRRLNLDGFEAEHMENVTNNAEYHNMSVEDFLEKRLRPTLRRYAAEHRKLPVYNQCQMLARDAAVALGEEDWKTARFFLQRLSSSLVSPDVWAEEAGKFDPNYGNRHA